MDDLPKVYTGIADSTRHAGIMGVLHDNTLVDVRPFEEETGNEDDDRNARFNLELRETLEYLSGFIDCTYTPTLCHGVRIRIPTEALIARAHDIIEVSTADESEFAYTGECHIAETLEYLNSSQPWIFHFCGIVSAIRSANVVEMILMWLTMKGHERPSLHVFEGRRVISMAITPGCLMRPVSSLECPPQRWDELDWVDSLTFSTPAMMELYDYERPSTEQPLV